MNNQTFGGETKQGGCINEKVSVFFAAPHGFSCRVFGSYGFQ
jgi:hypothetical protein